ncbi:helix-turn-helix domain-containing protein [Motilimonas sp. E26]|uniref:helix-turn-helix domain-containing protein n=1 Tax=Motilimonas sp. E26 TaxID=2865674 RepID=UPI001E401CDB|nr:helix-turn-helix domain-containing protein [Motilimonas sp. E26]MCE0557243.1 helix-turn-helix domain-containing protein [Motilimonas sp. E26]
MDGRKLYDFFSLTAPERDKAFEQVIKENFSFNASLNFNQLSRDVAQTVGVNLKSTRKLRGFKTSSALAKRLNILPSKLNAWEIGKAKVPAHEIARWNVIFAVHPYLLFKNTAYQPLIKLDVISDEKSLKLQNGLSKLGFSSFEKLAKYAQKHAESSNQLPMCHLALVEKRLDNYSELDIEAEILERFYAAYGANLKRLRGCIGLSQKRLADTLFIGEERYRRIEKAQNTPKFEHELVLRTQLISNIVPVILMHDTLYGEYCVRFLSRYAYIKRLAPSDMVLNDLLIMIDDFLS